MLGFVDEMEMLADQYLEGGVAEEDADLAYEWLKKAADKGLVSAMCTMAWMHAEGKAADASSAEAVVLYKRAAEKYGSSAARVGLAAMYMFGTGVTQSVYQARLLLHRAAGLDNDAAMLMCGLATKYEARSRCHQESTRAYVQQCASGLASGRQSTRHWSLP
ncbi:hypothetical protein BC828DRAFT_285379 [Blastocladiella britannica]|nr:hypothetical protein BC828DRAFT_285379 [Blastocladiella britannica]